VWPEPATPPYFGKQRRLLPGDLWLDRPIGSASRQICSSGSSQLPYSVR